MKYLLDQAIHASSIDENYQCLVTWRSGSFVADEPVSLGGQDKGPDPFTLLAASLASCTISTLRMYCHRKNWPLKEVQVSVNFYNSENTTAATVFERKISLSGNFDKEQYNRLLQIAKACPVSKILSASAGVETELQVQS
jgi:putative redox protein